MTEKNRAVITLKLANGTTFSQWEQATIRERFDDALGSYSFTIKPTIERLRYFQKNVPKGELVRISINDHPYATAIIETVTTSLDRGGGVTMSIEGKSTLLTATEASADPTIYEKQKADVPIAGLIDRVMAPFGFTGNVRTDVAGNVLTLTGKSPDGRAAAITADSLKAKDAAVQDNETAYAYCARLFSRLGVALRVDHEGKLMLAAPDYDQNPHYTVTDQVGGATRAVSMVLKETNRGQFSKIVIKGKGGEQRGKKQTAKPRAALKQGRLTGRFSKDRESIAQAAYVALSIDSPYPNVPTETTESDQPLYTSSVHPFKPRYYVDKRSRDNERCASFCKLVHTKDAPNAFELTVVVDGLTDAYGTTWAIDTICHVRSETLDLYENMWIHEVTMSQSRRKAQTTLKLIPKHSLILGDIPG